jgi:hypothetical protein
MHYTAVVGVFEGVDDLLGVIDGGVERLGAREIIAFDEFHGDGAGVGVDDESVDGGDRGVVKGGEDFGFALEAAMRSGSRANSGGRILRATSRLREVSRAR